MRSIISLLALAVASTHGFAVTSAVSSARVSQAPLIHHATRSAAPARMAQSDEPDYVDRAFAAAVYFFPITDGFQFGKFIYASVPPVGALAQVIAPSIQAFDAIPFSGLIFFFGLSALSRNPGLSRFLRFSLQQAILLDIAFIIPGFVGGAGKMFPLAMQQVGCNTIFYAMVLSIGYAWYSIAQGKTPDQIPIVSDAANQAIGPF